MQVKPCASNEKNAPAAGGDVLLHPPGFGHKAGDVPILTRVSHIDEVMSDARPLGHRRLGGTDVHPAVDLHRVSRHDLDVTQFLSYQHPEGRFTRGSWAY